MTEVAAVAEASPADKPGQEPLPRLRTALRSAEVFERLSKESKRGKLPGYVALMPPKENGAGAARVLAFGGVYDYEMLIDVSPEREAAGSRVGFRLNLLKKMPWIAIGLIVFTIFPGLPLTDSMLSAYFEWYRIETWWWYLPLTLLMLPMMWKQFRRSQTEARKDACETIEKIARLIEGTRVPTQDA